MRTHSHSHAKKNAKVPKIHKKVYKIPIGTFKTGTVTLTVRIYTKDFVQHFLTQDSDSVSLLTLSTIALAVIVPLAYIWNAYLFSVGYGASIAVAP